MSGLLLYLCLVVGGSIVYGQPVVCRNDEQCSEGYYCEKSVKICYECLRCQDLKREPPTHLSPSACIQSVVDCGPCMKGLVVDHRGNLNAECVPPDGREEEAGLPPYVWALIVMGLLLLVLVIGIIVAYVLKNPDALKVLVSTNASVSRASFSAREEHAPAAPDAPPPYNPAHYTPVRPDSPSTFAPPGYQSENDAEESSAGWRKRVSGGGARGAGGAREAPGTQAARVYNPPAYLRPHEPSLSPVSTHEVDNDNLDNHFTLHDEDTTESLWTPHATNNAHVNGTAGVESEEADEEVGAGALVPVGAGAGAGGEVALGPPPAKLLCTRQDSNNNRNRESNACSGDSTSGNPSSTQNNIYINVMQYSNTK